MRDARRRGLSSALLDYLEGKLAHQRGERGAARAALQRALAAGLPPPVAADARSRLASLGG